MPFHRECIQQSCTRKQGMIASREHARQNNGIDDAPGSIGARHLEHYCERRDGSAAGAQAGIGIRHIETDEQDGKHTKNTEEKAKQKTQLSVNCKWKTY